MRGTLEVFDAAMTAIGERRRIAGQMISEADSLEAATYKRFGITWIHDKEPGDGGWSHDLLPDVYHTPREALVALVKMKNETSLDSASL